MTLIPATKGLAEGQLDAGISASSLSIALGSGEGAEFPQPYNGSCSSTGDSETLNDTGDLGDLAVGNIIHNVTDDSWAVVTSISGSPDSVTTTRLVGGTDNTWTSGDTWRVNEFVISLEAEDANGVTKRERALISDRSTDTLIVPSGGRGYDGSIAQSFDAGDYVRINVLSLGFESIKTALADIIRQVQSDKDTADTRWTDLASTDNAKGASLIGVEDSAGNFTGTDVEAILAELFTAVSADAVDKAIFGDASDGNVTLSGDDTLTRDMFYDTLDLSTHTLNTGGFKVFARTITGSGGKIKAPSGGNGGNGSNGVDGPTGTGGGGGSAGAAAGGGTLPNSLAGKAGVTGGNKNTLLTNDGSAGSAVTNSLGTTAGANGVAGGAGGDGGFGDTTGEAGSAANGSTPTQFQPIHLLDAIRFGRFDANGGTWIAFAGCGQTGGSGAGGGGGDASQGGGGGGSAGSGANGGFFLVCARTISGTWSIESLGGNGGNGGNGGAAGGGGGAAGGGGGGGAGSGGGGGSGILVYDIDDSSTVTFTLTGGSAGTGGLGGAGANGGQAGSNGSNGNAGATGILLTIAI